MEEKRRRGGQKGNRNALKHGYYSKVFQDKADIKEYCKAADVEGIDEEIALIRYVIKCTALSGSEKNLSILVRATNALNRLIRTRQKLVDKNAGMKEGIGNIIKELLLPLGPDVVHAVVAKKLGQYEGTNQP
jgi:hypothetical protein